MYLLIDNYDSFTYNLYHYLLELGANVTVYRNDHISVNDAVRMQPSGIIISPGPCTPNEAGISLDLIRQLPANTPLLGVCLGHQALAAAYGGHICRAPYVMHGKTSLIDHDGSILFRGIPSPFCVTRYHSLIAARENLPDCFNITATSNDGLIMAIAHKTRPLFGVQFHPESIASEHGHQLLQNFLTVCEAGA